MRLAAGAARGPRAPLPWRRVAVAGGGARSTTCFFAARNKRLLHATRAAAALPPRPVEPADGECCGSDCRDCVWTEHWRALEAWQAAREREEAGGGDGGAGALAAEPRGPGAHGDPGAHDGAGARERTGGSGGAPGAAEVAVAVAAG